MPELPEVETTRIGIAPFVLGEIIEKIIIRQKHLRWPVPAHLKNMLVGNTILKLSRRGKYLIFQSEKGNMILHLGMSGSLRILTEHIRPEKHDHVDFIFTSGTCLRFRDPRRFGCIVWTDKNPLQHELLVNLGPEPLSNEFNGEYLFAKSRKRIQTVKTFIMDSRIVTGVGNIYANEALFDAGIHPGRMAGKITGARYEKLSQSVKSVLYKALAKGGTTLRDFVDGQGNPGYFRLQLQVYDRAGQPCVKCKTPLKVKRIGQRSAFFCPHCQK